MKSGYFNYDRAGGYTIIDPDLSGSYGYNLMGRDVLIALDQNGIIKIQAYPPNDVLFVRREGAEKYSKWLTFVVSEGKTYCNFNRPGLVRPIESKVEFLPEKAIYTHIFEELRLQTTVFAPMTGADAIVVTELCNLSEEEKDFSVYPQVFPFMNPVTVSAWDIPSWYLRTSLSHDEEKNLYFFTRLMNPRGEADKRRNAVFLMSGDGAKKAEYYMEHYVGAGDFFSPDALLKDVLSYDFSQNHEFFEMGEENSIAGFQPIYAARYDVTLKKGEKRRFTQVFSLLPSCGGEIPPKEELEKKKAWLKTDFLDVEIEKAKGEYEKLFSVCSVKSGDREFDNYVNAFLPLQMKWVAALDRGWATGMRGTRDASNDFMGLLYYDEKQPREVLLHLYDCQRSDGWFPRQVGNIKSGPHDLRGYVDGGVFALEFLYEYIVRTKDFSVLKQEVAYLDDEKKESMAAHAFKALSYYAAEENIGRDGLCKIREGDWFDGVNQAGLKGEGQSVTVSCQFYMATKYVKALFKEAGIKADFSLIERSAKRAADAVREKAFNGEFFNGLKNDEGHWVFSDRDEDGQRRMFAVPNAFAIFSGVATEEQAQKTLQNFRKMKTDTGYKLFSAPFKKKLQGVGRVASGDVIEGLLGNYTVYNHGSQGFLARACTVAGDGDMAKDALLWLFPYDQTRHPEEKTGNAPYAIVNCYQDVPPCRHKTGFSFLTGAVAMAVRIVYSCLFGIHPTVDGIEISPCLPSDFQKAEITYKYGQKALRLYYRSGEKEEVTVGGITVPTRRELLTGKKVSFLSEQLLHKNTEIYITVGQKK